MIKPVDGGISGRYNRVNKNRKGTKNMKKFIAVLLTLTLTMALGMPAFATSESAASSDAQTENPAVTEEEILDIMQSEEMKNILEEEGVSSEEVEEEIENGDYIVFEDREELEEYYSEEEIEALRKELALMPLEEVWQSFLSGMTCLVLLPAVPVMLIVPVFGWVTSAAVLVSPFLLISTPFQFIIACFKAIDVYINFDPYEYYYG